MTFFGNRTETVHISYTLSTYLCCLSAYIKRLLIASYSVQGGCKESAGYGKRPMSHSSSVGNVITGWPTGKSYRSLVNRAPYGVTLLRLT